MITIRGVGLNDFGATNSPSAGVYVDQVYVASIAMMAFDMFDLERIEVLKGPQGTLYGRNSTAGALNIITRKPQQSFDAYTTLGYGNYDTLDFEGCGQRAARRDARRCASAARPFSRRKATGKAAGCRARRSAIAT